MMAAYKQRDKPRVDFELGVAVQEALHQDERLSAQVIDVTVVDRVATLSGAVQSYRRKAAAIETTESIRGCRGVIDQITVEPAGTTTDDEIADNVRAALDAHADVTREVIAVSVNAGHVTLQGRVASRWERKLAEDVALSARGVRGVRNVLLVDLASKIEDEALTTSIQHAIATTGGLYGESIRVAVHADTAVLSGEVSEVWQKTKAEKVASRFRVTEVRNEILVGGK